jgi:hypothetical protein
MLSVWRRAVLMSGKLRLISMTVELEARVVNWKEEKP